MCVSNSFNSSLVNNHQPRIMLTYNYVFSFEENFQHADKLQWMRSHHYLPFYATALYLAVIFWLQHFMKDKTPLNLRTPLVIWNITLAVYNVFSALRAVPNYIIDLSEFGFYFTLCSGRHCDPVTLLWAWSFTVSKFAELADTLFIVLRKRKLIFLHWYHHVTVLVMTWFVFVEMAVPSRAMWTMNAFVHAIMYTYYAITAMKFKFPRWVSMSITTIQITQMFIGIFIASYVCYLRANNVPCLISDGASNVIFVIYFSYLLLFLNFFYQTYVVRSGLSGKLKKEA